MSKPTIASVLKLAAAKPYFSETPYTIPGMLEASARELPQAVRMPELGAFEHRYDRERDVITFFLTNGEDVEVSVRPVSDAAIDRARFGVSYDVEALNGTRDAKRWVAMNESWAIEIWEEKQRG